MKTNLSLRTRLVLSFTLLSAVIAMMLAFFTYIIMEISEERLIEKTIVEETDMLAVHFVEFPKDIVRTPKHFLLYVRGPNQTDPIPEEIKSLSYPRGDVTIGDTEYRLIHIRKEPYDFYFLFDFSRYEIFERSVYLILFASVLVATMSGIWLGLSTSHRVIDPLCRLEQSLGQEPDGDGAISISRDFGNDEVGALAAKFIDYNERMKSHVKKEKAFTADVSHELRTPTAVIAGAAEVLENSSTLNPGDRHAVSRIRHEANNMREQLNLLLAMARGLEQFGDEDAVNVSDIVTEQLNELKPKYRAKNILVEVVQNEETSAFGSKTAMQIIIGNILDNAVSYTTEGKITVTIDKNSIVIEDTGPGIPADIQEKVFDQFYRGNQPYGITHAGIGLSLVQRLCEVSHWKIVVETVAKGRGTRVTLLT